MAFNGGALDRRIKVRNAQATPTLVGGRVPTQEELREIFLAGDLRERSAAVLMAHAGLRPEALGNYQGTNGLRLGDLPDIIIWGKKVQWR